MRNPIPRSRPARSRYVLLVESDPEYRSVCRAALEEAGYGVLEAADGLAGVRGAEAHRPDLILMEGSLPGMSGWEATRLLRQNASTASIPVLALTGILAPEAEQDAREAGCDGHLAKSADPHRVTAVVRAWIGPARAIR